VKAAFSDVLLDLPAQPRSAALARAGVAELRVADGAPRDALLIVVSELVTNAVRHAGMNPEALLTVSATLLSDRVRVEVVDHGAGFDRSSVATVRPSVRGGFGLRIVEALSDRWGVGPDEGTVWAEVLTGPAEVEH
jgi:anti-sigma regulatory factor (Ser/Thr protein kinase)